MSDRQFETLKILLEKGDSMPASSVGRLLAHRGLGSRGRNLSLAGQATLSSLERLGYVRSWLKPDGNCWWWSITTVGKAAYFVEIRSRQEIKDPA